MESAKKDDRHRPSYSNFDKLIERAPVPHPYPVAQYIQSEITDTFDATQTVTTN